MKNKGIMKRLSLLVLLLMAGFTSAMAQSLTIDGFKINPGEDVTVVLKLDQAGKSIYGLQTDIVLSEGLTLVGKPAAVAGAMNGESPTFKTSTVKTGATRVVMFSMDGMTFVAGQEDVVSLTVSCTESFYGGTIQLTNTRLTMSAAGEELSVDDCIAQITTDNMPPKAPVENGTYYIKNVSTGKYLSAGADWSTRAVVNTVGLDYIVTSVDGLYTIDSQVSNGINSHYLNNNGFNDQPEFGWTITEVSDGIVRIGDGNGLYLTADADNIVNVLETESDAGLWKFVTLEERLADLQAATSANPMDATFLIKDPNFGRNDSRKSNWSVLNGRMNLGGISTNYVAEFYHCTFNVTQVISNVLPGTYAMTAQGFYRLDGNDNDNLPYFFVNDKQVTFPVKTGSENSMTDASNSFSAGLYTIEPIIFQVGEDGQITLGVKNDVNTEVWGIFDNFQLTYYGEGENAWQDYLNLVKNSVSTYIIADGTLYTSSYLTAFNDSCEKVLTAENQEQLDAILARVSVAKANLDMNIELWKALQDLRSTAIAMSNNTAYANVDGMATLKDYVELDLKKVFDSHDFTNKELEAEVAKVQAMIDTVLINSKNDVYEGKDMTIYITNPGFDDDPDINNGGALGWTIEKIRGNNSSGYNIVRGPLGQANQELMESTLGEKNFCFEAWHGYSWNVWQEISDLPTGMYELQVQGFVRCEVPGYEHGTPLEPNFSSPVYLYMNNAMSQFPSVYAEQVDASHYLEDGTLPKVEGHSWTGPVSNYPNSMGAASLCFKWGMYKTTAFGLIAKKGDSFRIGVKMDVDQDWWCIFDNFKLIYHVPTAEMVQPLLETELAKIDLTRPMDKAIRQQAETVIADAQAAIKAADGQAMFEALSAVYDITAAIITSADMYGDLIKSAEILNEIVEYSNNPQTIDTANALMKEIETAVEGEELTEQQYKSFKKQIEKLNSRYQDEMEGWTNYYGTLDFEDGMQYDYLQSYDWSNGAEKYEGLAQVVVDPTDETNHCVKVVSRNVPENLPEDQETIEDYDTQFFITLPEPLPANSLVRLSMRMKADKTAVVSTECHAMPSEYISWRMFGNMEIGTTWQNWTFETYLNEDQSQAQTIAFDLALLKEANNYYFDDIEVKVIKGEEEIVPTVDLALNLPVAGTLNDSILNHVNNIGKVKSLSITGKLNDADLRTLKSMVNVKSLDLEETDLTVIPSDQFYEFVNLSSIKLPKGLTFIGYNAFNNCHSLKSIEFPSSLISLESGVFWACDSLETVIFGDGLETIGPDAFGACSRLVNLTLPKTLKVIESWAFESCTSLKSITFPEGMTTIYYNAFYGCTSLEEVTLPSSMTNVVYAFTQCNSLTKMTLNAFTPPTTDGYLVMGGLEKNCTLYVPDFSIGAYQEDNSWGQFNIVGSGVLVNDIFVKNDLTIDWKGAEEGYKPNISLTSANNNTQYGKLTVNGDATLSVGMFDMLYDPNISRENVTYYDVIGYTYNRFSYTALLNNASMRADNVRIWYWTREHEWDFISFPFDVKLSDIHSHYTDEPFVVRKYDGAKRGEGLTNETWVDMTDETTLEAGQGYIFRCASTEAGRYWVGFYIDALQNANKNKIFVNDDVEVPLNFYESEFDHNRSWNLIGNPYPCYYDTRAMQFSAPITVWDTYQNNYRAYSPADDAYILNPGQAFFVQRPADQESITFKKEGRQTNLDIRPVEYINGSRENVRRADRSVFNLTLTSGEHGDRTRFVINPKASRQYETNCDASKFMSIDKPAVQLYTLESGVRYAINERPFSDGIISLGMEIAEEGVYTFKLDTKADNEVYLIDNLMGREYRLDGAEEGYTFQCEAGVNESRFSIRLGGGETTGVKSVVTDQSADQLYDLQGRRISAPQKGIYVKNGKKTVLK